LSNSDPGKIHKGETNERDFIIYGLLRNSFTSYSSLEITQTYLYSPGDCSLIFEPKIRTTVRLSKQRMMYELSSICMPNFCCNYVKIPSRTMPWKPCQIPLKSFPEFMTVHSLISMQVRTDYMDFSHWEKRAQHPPQFLCLEKLYDNLGIHANTLKKSCCCSPRNLCTLNVVRPLKSVLYEMCFLVVCCLFSSSTSLILLLSKQNEMNNLSMVHHHTLIDLMLGRWGVSHPTVENGLDEWLRLSVSSLTSSLKS